ncbi:MAG: tetratricopeptide repeat protein [Betaproteobacteria bacterium]
MLASLAVVVAADLERSLAAGDLESASGLRYLVGKKLPDTSIDLARIGRHGAGGADFALGVMALHGLAGPRDRPSACALFASAWDKGFAEAAFRLSGCVAASNPTREAVLLEAAAATGHATASEQIGRRCLEAKPPDAGCAFARLSAAATGGRASAKSLLAWMYAQGVGVPADPARALALYLQAAGAGDLSAKNNLGEMHETGRGVPADAVRAAQFYREAAEAGFAPAQFNLGRLYATGNGVPRDAGNARLWLRAALDGGVAPAQKLLDWLDTPPGERR